MRQRDFQQTDRRNENATWVPAAWRRACSFNDTVLAAMVALTMRRMNWRNGSEWWVDADWEGSYWYHHDNRLGTLIRWPPAVFELDTTHLVTLSYKYKALSPSKNRKIGVGGGRKLSVWSRDRTNAIEHRPPCEADSRSHVLEMSRLSLNLNIHYRICRRTSQCPEPAESSLHPHG